MTDATTTHDEVVTHARVRTLDLPLGAGRMALITIDNDRDHTRPSTFGPGGLGSLEAAIDEVGTMAAAGEIAAVAVTGKPFIFAVGADLSAIGLVKDKEVIRVFGKRGHDVFRRLGELSVPSFAFVNGAAMGGGTELALHCTYRTMSTGAAAMSLPEVFLGLIPGWGGAWLAPVFASGVSSPRPPTHRDCRSTSSTMCMPVASRLCMPWCPRGASGSACLTICRWWPNLPGMTDHAAQPGAA